MALWHVWQVPGTGPAAAGAWVGSGAGGPLAVACHTRHAVPGYHATLGLRNIRRCPGHGHCVPGDTGPSCRNIASPKSRYFVCLGPCRGFRDCDFNLGGLRIRNSRGRVVSRPWSLNDDLGYRAGHASSRFTGSPAAPAIHCAGYKVMFFLRFFDLRERQS